MKQVLKLCLFLIIIISCFFIVDKVSAQTLGELKSELADLKAKYNSNQEAKNLTEAEITKVKNQIQDTNNQIETLNNDIEKLNADIERRNQEIAKMNEEIKSIVHYYQVTSSESFYLEYVFNASNFTDFIYRLAISEQLSEYREKKITEYRALIEENKKKVNEIAAKKVKLKELQEQLEQQKAKLGKDLTGITEAGIGLKDDIADVQRSINLYQNTYKCSDSEDLSSCVTRYNRQHSSSSSSGYAPVPAAAGFFRPMDAGYVSAPFGDHDNGMDIAVKEGTSVRPIADGVVASIWTRYSCGGNMVFINHTVNGTNYISAYFHLWTVNVSVGQQVSHTTVIGTSGGQPKNHANCSANCSSVDYNNYDSCTSGPHLHLQLAKGLHYSSYSSFNRASVNPAPYVGY